MPTVSTGGAPLTAIGSTAATALRQTMPADGRFEAMLPPVAAELGNASAGTAQPKTLIAQNGPAAGNNQVPDQPEVALQLVKDAAASLPGSSGNDAGLHPSESALNTEEPGETGDPAMPSGATTSVKSLPASADVPVAPDTVRTGAGSTPAVPTGLVTASAAFLADPGQGQNQLSPLPNDTSKNATPVSNEATPQSNARLATKAERRSQADEQNPATASPAPSVGTVAVAEPPIIPAAAAIPQPGAANPSEVPVEASTLTHASATWQKATAKASRGTTTTTVADQTDPKQASAGLQLNIPNAAPVLSAAASVGAHPSAKLQSDPARSSPLTSAGTLTAVPPGAQVLAIAQSGASNSPAIAATVDAGEQPSAASQSKATVAASAGAPGAADSPAAVLPLSDPGNQHQDSAAASADSVTPAPSLAAGTGMATASAVQGQSHDARADPSAPPLVTAGVAGPAAPSAAATVPPSAPAAPSTGTVTEQVAIHIAQSLNDGARTVTVELHPAELGRVEIHFSFHTDGMSVSMTVDRPETFAALSHDRSGLQQQLTQAGVDLGGGGLDLRLGQQQPDQSGGYSSARTSRVTMATPQPATTPASVWVSNSLLDILA